MQQPSEITEAEENHKYSLYVSQDDVHGKPISDGGDWFSTTNQSGMLRRFSKCMRMMDQADQTALMR